MSNVATLQNSRNLIQVVDHCTPHKIGRFLGKHKDLARVLFWNPEEPLTENIFSVGEVPLSKITPAQRSPFTKRYFNIFNSYLESIEHFPEIERTSYGVDLDINVGNVHSFLTHRKNGDIVNQIYRETEEEIFKYEPEIISIGELLPRQYFLSNADDISSDINFVQEREKELEERLHGNT